MLIFKTKWWQFEHILCRPKLGEVFLTFFYLLIYLLLKNNIMNNLNEHINRMRQLIGAKHGIIKPLVSEQSPFDDEFDDFINKPNQPTPPKENDLQKGMPSQYKSSEKLYGDDEYDDLFNKRGSGKNITSSVPMTILNKTTGKEETINADFYEDEVAVTVKAMTSMLEPAMIVLVGIIVGSVLLAMYLPMFSVFENIR